MNKRFARFMSGKRIQTQRRRLGMFLIEQEVANGDRDWEQPGECAGCDCSGGYFLDSDVRKVRGWK